MLIECSLLHFCVQYELGFWKGNVLRVKMGSFKTSRFTSYGKMRILKMGIPLLKVTSCVYCWIFCQYIYCLRYMTCLAITRCINNVILSANLSFSNSFCNVPTIDRRGWSNWYHNLTSITSKLAEEHIVYPSYQKWHKVLQTKQIPSNKPLQTMGATTMNKQQQNNRLTATGPKLNLLVKSSPKILLLLKHKISSHQGFRCF